ncbi:MAG: DUF3788 family protein [Sphaerochaetaceae bacterium]
MSYGSLTERGELPSEEKVRSLLGDKRTAWDDICSYMVTEKKTKGTYAFYGKNYGWALRFSKGGKSILALYPSKGDFFVQTILNPKQEEVALSAIADEAVRTVVHQTEPIHEGKWIFLKFSDIKDPRIIKALVDIRLDKHLH